MNEKLNVLVAKAKHLESEMLAEPQERRQKFGYEMEGRAVRFHAAVRAEHRKIAKSFARYLLEAKWLNIITAPMIWICVFPILFMDVVAEAYQFVCFPIYGIPKVRRKDYVVMDRSRLLYLNSMERFNCAYCGYVNGVLAYVQEIAGRTEQHWCPIKQHEDVEREDRAFSDPPFLTRKKDFGVASPPLALHAPGSHGVPKFFVHV